MKKIISLIFSIVINAVLVFSQTWSVSWKKDQVQPDKNGNQFIFFHTYTDYVLEKENTLVSLKSPLTNKVYKISCNSEEEAESLFRYISLRITYYIVEDGTWYHHTVRVKGVDGNYVTGYAGGGENKMGWKEFLDYLTWIFESSYATAKDKYMNDCLILVISPDIFYSHIRAFVPEPHYYYSSETADHIYADIDDEESMKEKIFSCYSEKKTGYWKISS